MIKIASAVTCLLLVGCASTRPEALSINGALEPSPEAPSAGLEPATVEPAFEHAAQPAPSSFNLTSFVAEPEPALDSAWPSYTPTANPAVKDEGLRHSRWTLKGGYYGSSLDTLDSGWIVDVSWMRFFTPFLALELEAGYFSASGSSSGTSSDLWGIPLMANARLNLPVWFLDLYGGLGIGTIYYDAETTFLGTTFDASGFALAGDAFLGLSLNLADSIALGLEGKYYVTDNISEFDDSLNAVAGVLTLGFSR